MMLLLVQQCCSRGTFIDIVPLEQDAFDRAYNRDVEGAQADAIKLYRMGLNIVYEGLSLQVQSSGLGAGYSNVAKWRDDMNTWQQHVLSRLVA